MKDFTRFCIVVALLCLSFFYFGCTQKRPDSYFYSRAVKLMSAEGQCSGEQVRAPSGKDYILTAGHCLPLAVGGRITVILENGKKLKRKVLAEDSRSDLLLLEGVPGLEGLEVAETMAKHDVVRTYTNGKGHDAYKTEGELMETTLVDVLVGPADKCSSMPKFKVAVAMSPYGPVEACLLSVKETFSTAMTRPGSSGGMVVDAQGRLVGVVSAGDGTYSLFVPLKDIRRFLSKR